MHCWLGGLDTLQVGGQDASQIGELDALQVDGLDALHDGNVLSLILRNSQLVKERVPICRKC